MMTDSSGKSQKMDETKETTTVNETDQTTRNKKYDEAIIADFLRNSSVHGIKYIGERHRHWSERMFWVIAFIISFSGCSVMIYKIYWKWQLTPVIVSFAENSTPIWEIPFPAVTICPETKSIKEELDFSATFRKLKNMDKINENQTIKQTIDDILTLEERKKLEAVAQVCDLHLLSNITSFDNVLESNDIISTLKQINVWQNDSLLLCNWGGDIQDCSEVVDEVITEEGVCYSFNILNSGELFKIEK